MGGEEEEGMRKRKKEFKKGKEMVWKGKMGLGKRVCGVEVVKDIEFEGRLIVSDGGVVDGGWFEDLGKIF